jgi:hypothetical protein
MVGVPGGESPHFMARSKRKKETDWYPTNTFEATILIT